MPDNSGRQLSGATSSVAAASQLGEESLLPPNALVSDEDLEDFRLAVVMSGGVSLCVWMGGVTLEIDRLRRRQSVYDELLTLTQSTVRVDVISGTSAGGLNGVLLGSAIAYRSTLEDLREVWFQKADFEQLLRSPFQAYPRSLLMGDEYFLKEIEQVIFELQHPQTPFLIKHISDPSGLPDPELQLVATCSLIRGQGRRFFDDFGQLIPEVTHRGEFQFRGRQMGGEDITFRLAVAARSSAAHPGGFEASFAPWGISVPEKRPVVLRPDMQGFTDWEGSRYVLDGGILVNRPLRSAIREILRQPAAREVRRAITFVVPDPPTKLFKGDDDLEGDMPTAFNTWLASAELPRNQTIIDELEELERHNRRVRTQRILRARLYNRVALTDQATLSRLADALYPSHTRLLRSQTAERILEVLNLPAFIQAEPAKWNKGAVRDAVETGYERVFAPPSNLNLISAVKPLPGGARTVETMALMLLDLITKAIRISPPERQEEGLPDQLTSRQALRNARGFLHRELEKARDLQEAELERWRIASKTAAPTETPEEWVGKVTVPGPELEQLISVTQSVAANVVGLVPVLRRAIDEIPVATAASGLREAVAELRQAADLLNVDPPAADGEESAVLDEAIRLLFSLEILQSTLLGYEPVPDQLIDLVQVSANAPNSFDHRTRPDEKLTGLQLAHFGAFYKESWKANDFMWGRLDGSLRLIQIILNPRRLLRVAATIAPGRRIEEIARVIRIIATGENSNLDDRTKAYLSERARGYLERVKTELAFLDNPQETPPPILAVASEWIAIRVQLEAISDEMPHIVSALRNDGDDDAAIHRSGRRLMQHYRKAICPPESEREEAVEAVSLTPEEAVALFTIGDIGHEALNGEFGTDKFTRVATTAAAVGVNMLAGERGGLPGPLRALFASLRGITLGTYVVARTALKRSRTTFALLLMATVLAAGVLVAHYGTELNAPGIVTTVAWVVIAAAAIFVWLSAGIPGPILSIFALAVAALFVAQLIPNDSIKLGATFAIAIVFAMTLGSVVGGGVAVLKTRRPWVLALCVAGLILSGAALAFMPATFSLGDGDVTCSSPFRGEDGFEPSVKPTEPLSDEEKKENQERAQQTCRELRNDLLARIGLVLLSVLFIGFLYWNHVLKRQDQSDGSVPAPN